VTSALKKVHPVATIHVPVLSDEVVHWLAPHPGQVIVDGTVGGGGHAALLVKCIVPGGFLFGIDRDPRAVAVVAERLKGEPASVVCGDYGELPTLLRKAAMEFVDAVLLDLGLSSDQLAQSDRGFSYESPGDLDLRFNPSEGEPAWRLLERYSAEALADLIYQLGEERFSRRIARRIVEQRERQPIRTATQLAQLVRGCVPRARHHRIDPATRTFQALRIAVNDELGSLDRGLERIPDCLKPGGRLAIISFHSLEDRRVKQAFRADPRLLALTKKPIRPNESELARNPRCRSARLRVATRIGVTGPRED
jgi:16S rRNA (cytosine1402-N4)-methyltransferase